MLFQTTKLQKPVFFDHDGGIDDLVALILLLTMDNVRLTGVSVVEGDCIAEQAIESTLRIASLFCRHDIEVARSEAEAVNPFRESWRKKPGAVNSFEELRNCVPDYDKYVIEEAADFLARKLMEEPEKTTIVSTGPCTNLVNALERHPEIEQKIEQIVWMGGAFLENGNVMEPDHDGSAEWNVFWDPISAKKLLQSGLNVLLFPLDACAQVPLDEHLLFELNEQVEDSKLSSLVQKMYQLVHLHDNYFMWDVLTAAYVGKPQLARLVSFCADVEIRGTSKGNTYKTNTGNPIRIASCVNENLFYEYFLRQLSSF